MALIDNDFIQNVIDQNDIVNIISSYIQLIRKGHSYTCICPFHDDTNPSMSIDERKQIFKCFVCGTGGNVLTFLMKYKKLKLVDAIALLSEKAGIDFDITKYKNTNVNENSELAPYYELLDQVNALFKSQLFKENDEKIIKFIQKRKLDFNLCSKFDIGFANEVKYNKVFEKDLKNKAFEFVNAGLLNPINNKNYFLDRITFAIRDIKNNVIGFSARALDDSKPKYLNSPESEIFKKQNILYNLYNALESNSETLIITEGFFDVIALYKAGFENAVCLMGTALTKHHIDLMSKFKKIILFLDGDNAGQNASYKSLITILTHSKKEIFVVPNETNLDPDEIFNKFGQQYVEKMLGEARPYLYFVFDYLRTKYGFYDDQVNFKVNEAILEKFANEFYPFLKSANKNQVQTIIERFKNLYNFDLNNAPNPESFTNSNINNNIYNDNKKQHEYSSISSNDIFLSSSNDEYYSPYDMHNFENLTNIQNFEKPTYNVQPKLSTKKPINKVD
ncbi:UNVERIFIED_CONTAM: DNA primase [Campylobacter lari]